MVVRGRAGVGGGGGGGGGGGWGGGGGGVSVFHLGPSARSAQKSNLAAVASGAQLDTRAEAHPQLPAVARKQPLERGAQLGRAERFGGKSHATRLLDAPRGG